MTEIGAANTLSFGADGIGADNTDASGLIAALPAGFGIAGARALVLGAGGSARACAWALDRAGAAVAIANRTQAGRSALAAELGVEASSAIGPGASLDLAGVRPARQRHLGRPCKRRVRSRPPPAPT